VINTTATGALPKGNTLYEVWFRRKPPTDFLNYKESARRARTALGGIGGEVESDESREDSLFVDEEAEQEEVAEEMILSELRGLRSI
jgi:hypothetical protein